MDELKKEWYSLTHKRVFSQDELKQLGMNSASDGIPASFDDLVKQFALVQVVSVAVYGTLRYRDSAYSWFKEYLANSTPRYEDLDGYKKVHHGSYMAAVPDPDAVMDVQVFYVYPDAIPRLDAYECLGKLYDRVYTKDGYYLYVKHE